MPKEKISKLIQRGEVYWVNLPIDNKRELQGQHPVVVISNNEQNKFSPLITITLPTINVSIIDQF